MKFPIVLAVALALAAPSFAKTTDATGSAGVTETTKSTALAHKKRRIIRHWHGYGFLPGVRTPEQIQAERDAHYWASGPHYYGPAYPRFYRGRWNGGGFGPCYTQTPIGPMWNCGR